MEIAHIFLDDSSDSTVKNVCRISIHKVLNSYHLELSINGKKHYDHTVRFASTTYVAFARLIVALTKYSLDDLIKEFREYYGDGQYYIGEIAHYYETHTKQLIAPCVFWKVLECKILGE
jgi:hypothetical protein